MINEKFFKETTLEKEKKKVSEAELKKIREWIEEQDKRIINPETKEQYNLFDDNLKFNLYFIKKDLEHNWDHFMVIDGKEGMGKSSFAMNIASYIDPSFEIKRVNFTAVDFIDDLGPLKKQCIMMDEAGTQLYSREAMKSMNILLNKIFMVSRAKNLFIILCIPSFFMLDSYVRDHRVNTLLHLTSRGHYIYYNEERAKSLSINGGKYKNHSAVHGNFPGYCNIKLAPNIKWEEYEDKKNNYIAKFLKDLLSFRDYEKKKETGELKQDIEIKVNTNKKELYTVTEACTRLGVSDDWIKNRIKTGEIPASKMGLRYMLHKNIIDAMVDKALVSKKSEIEIIQSNSPAPNIY